MNMYLSFLSSLLITPLRGLKVGQIGTSGTVCDLVALQDVRFSSKVGEIVHKQGEILNFFRPNILISDLKKSQICPSLDQSDPLWAATGHTCGDSKF